MTGPFDPVSTFLSIVEPWVQGTYINVEAYDWVPKQGGQPGEGDLSQRKGSRACRDVAEAANFCRWQEGLGREVYVRMAAHRQPGTGKVDKRGRTFYRALGGKANAALNKSFFIDVDVKPGAHQSTQEAVQAVSAMCAALGLPLPSIVVYSGGGGFHAHWVLEKEIPTADWYPIARKLAAACRAHGVHADHAITVNAVCMLRVPGTSNRKYGAPRLVDMKLLGPAVTIAAFEAAITAFEPEPEISSGTSLGVTPSDTLDLTNFPALKPAALDPRWAAGISSEPYTIEEVAGGCPWIKETLETGGKGQREPVWFEAAHVAVFTADGLKDFHRLSEHHDGYDVDATAEKFARTLENKVLTDQGWPRCQTIMNAGATQCAACPKLFQKKSPLNFAVRQVTHRGNDAPQPTVNVGDSPAPSSAPNKLKVFEVTGYTSDLVKATYLYEVNEKKGIRHVEVWDYPMWNLDYKRDDHGRYAIHFDTMTGKEEWVHVSMPTSALIDSTALRRCLWEGYGLSIHTDASKGYLNFMAAFTSQMREQLARVNRQELMGWSMEKGKPAAFIFGPTKFNCVGNTSFYQPNAMIRDTYFPTGALEPWMDAIRMINGEKRPEMDMLVATAFAAPLMTFTGEKGVVISAYSSGTAVHKTSALKVGQSVWGSFRGINQLTDTLNSVMARVGMTRIVPTYYDEMKSSIDIKKFAQMLYTFTGGRGKGRLNRNAEIRDVDTWDTLLVGVSNDSLFDYISQMDRSTDAGVARIFEFEVRGPNPGQGQVSMGTAGEVLKKLEANYGHAGMKFAEHLGRSVNTLPDEVTQTVNALQKALNAPTTERFWVAAAAVLLLGAQMANDINLTRFDVARMGEFVTKTFGNMRTASIAGDLDISKKDSIRSILATYVNTHRRMALATDTAGLSGRAGAMSPVQVLNQADVQLVSKFTVRFIQQPNPVLRLSRSDLVAWLSENQLPHAALIRKMREHYGAIETVTSITSGTSYAGSKERVLELDLNHPDLGGLYEIG